MNFCYDPDRKFLLDVVLGLDAEGQPALTLFDESPSPAAIMAAVLEGKAPPTPMSVYAEIAHDGFAGWCIAAVYLQDINGEGDPVQIPAQSWIAEKAEKLLLGDERFQQWGHAHWEAIETDRANQDRYDQYWS